MLLYLELYTKNRTPRTTRNYFATRTDLFWTCLQGFYCTCHHLRYSPCDITKGLTFDLDLCCVLWPWPLLCHTICVWHNEPFNVVRRHIRSYLISLLAKVRVTRSSLSLPPEPCHFFSCLHHIWVQWCDLCGTSWAPPLLGQDLSLVEQCFLCDTVTARAVGLSLVWLFWWKYRPEVL